jgi:hypothetical protein
MLTGRSASRMLALVLGLTACGPSTVARPQPSPQPSPATPPPPVGASELPPDRGALAADSAPLRPGSSPPTDPGLLRPGGPSEASPARIPQPRGGPEDPPPRAVAPPPPGPLPPRQTTRLGIGPPPPEVIHRPGSAATTAAEGQTAPSAPAPRRQLRDK